jgi:hypothetical protein
VIDHATTQSPMPCGLRCLGRTKTSVLGDLGNPGEKLLSICLPLAVIARGATRHDVGGQIAQGIEETIETKKVAVSDAPLQSPSACLGSRATVVAARADQAAEGRQVECQGKEASVGGTLIRVEESDDERPLFDSRPGTPAALVVPAQIALADGGLFATVAAADLIGVLRVVIVIACDDGQTSKALADQIHLMHGKSSSRRSCATSRRIDRYPVSHDWSHSTHTPRYRPEPP